MPILNLLRHLRVHISPRKNTNNPNKKEVKSLFKKKGKLNYELYKAHLKGAQEWGGGMWVTILSSKKDSLDKITEKNTAV